MTATASADVRPHSRQTSPVPRRQLGSLSVNQRSYSRMSSSKGIYGDESPLLSPLPYYPRRRSVTFAGSSDVREERPTYNGMYSASAPVSPVRKGSPPPVGILKKGASHGVPSAFEEDEGARPGGAVESQQGAAVRSHKGSARSSPVPRRGRSASRQRLAARRREAQLHHSFYDDSFVEEFVLSSKAQLEKEEEERRLQAQMEAEKEKARRAEQKMMAATDKISALQHAKEVLMAAAERRGGSTPTPSPARVSSRSEGKRSTAAPKETDLLKSLEEDSDPEIQSALAELSRVAAKSEASRRSRKSAHQRRSMPIVSESALLDSDEVNDDSDVYDVEATRRNKRAKLEKIVSGILSQQEKRGKSKRSVVVINWSDADDEASGEDKKEEEEDEEVVARARPGKRSRPAPTKSRSVALATEATLVPARGGTRKASTSRRAASSRKRHNSTAPDLGDSLLFENEEEQPILLPRRQQKRPVPTRSISALNAAADDLLLSEPEEASRRPPRRAPRTNRPAAKKTAAAAAPRADPFLDDDMAFGVDDVTPPRAPAPRTRRATGAATGRGAPKVSPDDPMSVFFDAAFPSPSKFDEMMQQAGGLPEARRGNGNRGRQPNLVLPSSIARRR